MFDSDLRLWDRSEKWLGPAHILYQSYKKIFFFQISVFWNFLALNVSKTIINEDQ